MLSSHGTHRLDSVSNAHDQLAILLHLVHKFHGQHATIKCFAELLCCSIQSASKTVTLKKTHKKTLQEERHRLHLGG